jgi:4-aminobutyrate aminotransferase/(S)-3-amino-2-methylpropionate transaminase
VGVGKMPKIVTEVPGPKSKALLAEREKYVPKGVFNTVPVFAEQGDGAMVMDVDGNTYIDFAGGIGVLNIGYSHPEVVAEVKKQSDKFFHTCFNVLYYEQYVNLAKVLCEITPGDFAKMAMFVNSGAEAVENAVKVARKYTGKTDIITFDGAFHGRTLMTMSLTSKVKPYKLGFGPFAPGIHRMPYPYCYRCPYGLDRSSCNLHCANELKEMFIKEVDPSDIAAVIIEPVQGEGGFVVAPNEYITALRKICDDNGIVLIADEVQTGFCRTGKMFACEHWDVVPDLITVAKSLGGGLPLAGIVGKKEIVDSPQVGGIGGTFGGNPVACAGALKIIEVMQRDNLADRSNAIGDKVRNRLNAMKEKYQLIGDVRGKGSMLAIELVKDRTTKAPAKDETSQIMKECYTNGLIILNAGMLGNVIRMLMPLVITDEQLDAALDILEDAVKKVAGN